MVRNWVKLIESEREPEGVVRSRESREGVGVWPVGDMGTGHGPKQGPRIRRAGQAGTSSRGGAWTRARRTKRIHDQVRCRRGEGSAWTVS